MNTIEDALTKIGFGKFQIISMIILGSIYACFGMSLMILSILGPTLSCYWRINDFELFLFSSGIFIGITVGSISPGRFSDVYGRKPTVIASISGMTYFTVISAIAPTIFWMIVIQIIIGIFMGGVLSTVFVLISELSSVKYRGTIMIMFQVCWTIGSFFTTTVCYFIIPLYGWRVLIVISAIPMLLATFLSVLLLESPRYLLVQNRKEDCLKALNIIAKMNNSEVIMDVNLERARKSSFWDLFHPNYVSTTILASFLFIVGCAIFFTIIFLTTVIDGIPHRCLQNMSTSSIIQINSTVVLLDNSCCLNVTWEGYKNMYISMTAPICSLPMTIVLINVIGRRKTFTVYSIILGIGTCLLNLCTGLSGQSILLFILSAFASEFSTLCIIYATEVFPTSIRSLGSGFSQACSRFGAFLAPFIVNFVMVKYSFIGGTMIIVCLCFASVFASLLLPYETKGRKLYQTVEEEVEREHIFKWKT